MQVTVTAKIVITLALAYGDARLSRYRAASPLPASSKRGPAARRQIAHAAPSITLRSATPSSTYAIAAWVATGKRKSPDGQIPSNCQRDRGVTRLPRLPSFVSTALTTAKEVRALAMIGATITVSPSANPVEASARRRLDR